jgi:ribosomal-protein-alanine N-acetyltransferase
MSMAEITLRRMTAADLEQVHALDQASFPTPWPAKSFRFELEENKAAHLWVAEKTTDEGQKKIVGSIAVWLLVDEVHIATIAVDAAHRRRGIASQLLFTVLSHLVDKGAIEATLEVRENNFAAQALYRGFGFRPVGRRRAYYKDSGEDAIIMALRNLDAEHLMRVARGRAKYMAEVNGGQLGT